MSYPVQAPSRRPGTVVSAAAVLLLMAAGAVAYAVANLLVTGGTVDRFRAAAPGTGASIGEIDTVVSLLRASTMLAAVIGVLMALLLVGLTLGLLSGRPGARVATWAVSGLGLFCGCCGLAVLVGQRAAPLRLGADEQVTADLLGLVGDAYPGWWIPLNAAVSVAQVLGYLVAAVLLALPAAGAFFRRTAPVAPPAGPMPPTGHMPPTGQTSPGAGPVYGPPSASSAPPSYGPPSGSIPPASGPPSGSTPQSYGSPSPWAPPPGSPGNPPPASAPPGQTPPPEERA
ncbi:hypothetical protein [Micromonospora narathiwatensis]|uniref:Uncharacterized protein n=1 Tax=Micromonospora narathiwatensis TaxID=299146 RepID=A0A1A9AC00_9ACTN|nr:hypothetical protein [Micromonospora narathiwatensis]SBT53663.1 hypothetical protein GA0070621_4884 [Micromonospora narathiwatensis]